MAIYAEEEVLTPVQAIGGRATVLPALRQVRSEPILRRKDLPAEAEAKARRAEYREGLAELLGHLDVQCAARRREHQRTAEAEKAEDAMQRQYQRALEASRGPEKPDWTYGDPLDYFQDPLIERGPSTACVKNERLQGIYAVSSWKPPHHEWNVQGGWNFHATNDKNQVLGEFGTKARQRMGPTERKFAERLGRKLDVFSALEKEEAIRMTSGAERRRLIEASAGEHSSLRRDKRPWADQAVTTHVYFSTPGPSFCDDEYDTSLRKYVEQPERTTSFERDIVAGDGERTSFWRAPPSGAVAGSANRHAKAQALLCPPGIRKLREEASRARGCATGGGGGASCHGAAGARH